MIEQFITNTIINVLLLAYFGWIFITSAFSEMELAKFGMVVFSLFICLFSIWNLFLN